MCIVYAFVVCVVVLKIKSRGTLPWTYVHRPVYFDTGPLKITQIGLELQDLLACTFQAAGIISLLP